MGVASKLDTYVQFERVTLVSDGFGTVEEWALHGDPIPALREDVKDTEAVSAGIFRAKLMARFLIRSTDFTRDISATDRLICEGKTFNIIGAKKPSNGQRRQLIEITGEANND
ncbi:MAG: head-tail adaptor protein [Loktanella sp.]|nr:head-tail adaptor protein [Loktanella sp.]